MDTELGSADELLELELELELELLELLELELLAFNEKTLIPE